MPTRYLPHYGASHALVIGINRYQNTGPLAFGVADAVAVADSLISELGFEESKVIRLLDGDATRAKITDAFNRLTRNGTGPDDRVIFFFAGHGHTEPTPRGDDVGFLVPSDGDLNNLATLVRWDELTRTAGLIAAKHVLFLMDACYGGLAVKRGVPPGAMRFLKDMLKRPSRQVLTAGKGDQAVDDCGDPLPGHSPFTGHLLQGIEGKAVGTNGIMTATGLMAYVYQAVASEPLSAQTPHYGQIDGDGDMILIGPSISDTTIVDDPLAQEDQLVAISIPAVNLEPAAVAIVDHVKTLLESKSESIRLFELVGTETRRVIAETAEDKFPSTAGWNPDEFLKRLEQYDKVLGDFRVVQTLLGRWASPANRSSVLLSIKRLTDQNRVASGNTGWLALRWYPSLVLFYATGIGALADNRYDTLYALFAEPTAPDTGTSGNAQSMVHAIFTNSRDVIDAFKKIEGLDRRYTPRSDYIFSMLQPLIEDALFLGSDYERIFDRFEVFVALQYAFLRGEVFGRTWGPPGRFVWKATRSSEVYADLAVEAKASGDKWPPLVAGFFGGSLDHFLQVHAEYLKIISQIGWF